MATPKKREMTDAEVEAIVAQMERLDYLYDRMAVVWREIEASLRRAQR